jgi:hypothetical protein
LEGSERKTITPAERSDRAGIGSVCLAADRNACKENALRPVLYACPGQTPIK